MLGLAMCLLLKLCEIASKNYGHEKLLLPAEFKAGQRRGLGRNSYFKYYNGPPPRPPVKAPTPGDEDCNSNPSLANSLSSLQDVVTGTDFNDYQWFLDYTLRDGTCQHTSVLSSISANYKGIGELTSRYDALARDLDANLAEVDMESFRTQDIHALLIAREAVLPHDENESTAGSINTMSICKSELLFSPVKEAPSTTVHFSTDSLDCDLPDGQDLIITCRANKDNYTIAFQQDNNTIDLEEENENIDYEERTRRNLELLERCQRLTDKLDRSMAKSETGYTTWGRKAQQNKITRHPSGNNNENSQENTETSEGNSGMSNSTDTGSVIKSQSLPNIYRNPKILYNSAHSNTMSNSTVDSYTSNKKLSENNQFVKVYDVSQNRSTSSQNSNEPMSTSTDNPSTSSDKTKAKQSMNLVKLFMKQVSLSNEGIMSNTVDLSDRSECWPHSSEGESSCSDPRRPVKMNTSEDGQSDREISEIMQYAEHKIVNVDARPMFDDLVEEDENESVGRCERDLYATVNKNWKNRTRKHIVNASTNSVSISSCSETDTQIRTQIPKATKATSTQAQVTTCDRSMQTSAMPVTNDKDFVKILEHSFLDRLKEVECEKPVFVLYPNYTLPDLSFLKNRSNIYLKPQNVSLAPRLKSKDKIIESKGKRPFSCNDIEILRKKGLGHIKDWDSLNFLLPYECKQVLSEVPEIRKHLIHDKGSPASMGKTKLRPSSCDFAGYTNVSSSSSTATQPSSGYRGSSTMLTDSSAQNTPSPNVNPMFVYRYDSATSSEASSFANQRRSRKHDQFKTDFTPPRPPLPKSILRKSMDRRKGGSKRFSMFEIDDIENKLSNTNVFPDEKSKRRSLQDTYTVSKNNDIAAKKLSKQFLDAAEKDAEYNEYFNDEGVGTESSLDSGRSNECKHKPKKSAEFEGYPFPDNLISSEELNELEEFLKQSGVTCQNMEDWDDNQFEKVRSKVCKFLTLKRSSEESSKSSESDTKKSVTFSSPEKLLKQVEEIKANFTMPISTNVTALASHRHYQGKNLAEIPICEENELLDEFGSPVKTKYDLAVSQKRALISNVTDAVEILIQHFSSATTQEELTQLGDSDVSPAVAKLALNALSPALYSVLRDGLKDNIESSFGPLDNNVWKVVESTARQGPITESLNELVMRINGEDVITEGLIKFNSFVLGLLNSHSLDTWISYIRTRESVLKKHYHQNSLLYGGCLGEPTQKALLDTLIACLEPLKLLPFDIDLMFEVKELHRSFKRIESDMRAASRPTSFAPALTLTQRNLLKLVRSIQTSCQSSTSQSHSQSSVILRHKPQQEPSTPDLLNDSGTVKPHSDKMRPRSCVNPSLTSLLSECSNHSANNSSNESTRRWSGVHLGSKLMQAFERLALCDDSDDYTDSLENARRNAEGRKGSLTSDTETWDSKDRAAGSDNSGPGCKFRRLQMKWERISNAADSNPSTPPGEMTSPSAVKTSRIPRPVTSPVRPASSPVRPVSSPVKSIGRSIPVAVNRKVTSPTTPKAQIATPVKKITSAGRISRVERAVTSNPRSRPTSLPQAAANTRTPPRPTPRASSSGSRIPAGGNNKHRTVLTICHRLSSESGHLAFSAGEKLRVVLEVDERYLLCCRGERKGLVPRDTIVFT